MYIIKDSYGVRVSGIYTTYSSTYSVINCMGL